MGDGVGMVEFLQWVSSADRLIGFLVLFITALGAFFAWVQRRGRHFVGDEVAPLRVGQDRQSARLDTIEDRLGGLKREVTAIDERMTRVERALPGLATKEDLIALKVQGAETSATMAGIGNKVDTLYRAALAANRREE